MSLNSFLSKIAPFSSEGTCFRIFSLPSEALSLKIDILLKMTSKISAGDFPKISLESCNLSNVKNPN